MVRRWCAGAIWAAPLGFVAVAAVATRCGRVDLPQAAVAAAVALIGVGGFRAAARTRGGVAGRAAELILVGSAVAWVLAEPHAHRAVVSLAGSLAAAALCLAAVWERASPSTRTRLAGLTGTAVGTVVAAGLEAAPGRWLAATAVVVSAAATSWLLARATSPESSVLAVVGLGPALGAAEPAAWALPLISAAALDALRRDRAALVALLAVAAGALPPAGLVLAGGLVVAVVRRTGSAAWLAAVAPIAGVALWRTATGVGSLAPGTTWEWVASALPLAPTAFPFLVPLAVAGLVRRSGGRPAAPEVLVVGLALMPLLGKGAWVGGAAAALWLSALPAAPLTEAHRRLLRATSPWTVGVALAWTLVVPLGDPSSLAFDWAWLCGGWLAAVALSFLAHPAARTAWMLPLAALAFTTPVEGVDVHLAAGERLELPAPAGEGWVFQLALGDGARAAPGTTVVRPVDEGAAPLLAGPDVPVHSSPPGWPLALPTRGGISVLRGLATRTVHGPTTWEAAVPVVLRSEAIQSWHERRRRLLALMSGAVLLVLAAHVVPGAAPVPRAAAFTALVGGLTAAGSAVEPLARAGFRDVADVAAVVWLGSWAALLPVVRHRRLLAALLLLTPLAAAQVVLRPPAGDEVYHLTLMESLARDHDLDPSNNLDVDNPHEAIYARHGEQLIHSPALAIAATPGYVLAGHGGALLLPALLVAAAAALAAGRARQLGLTARSVDLAWGLTLLTYPALTFATQVWPASAGMFLVALLLVAAARPSPLGAALAAAAALLVKVRLGLIVLPMAAAASVRRGRSNLLVLGAMAAVALAAVAVLLGTPLGRHRLGELVPPDPVRPLVALWGLLWDPAGGLLFAAPLWLAACLGLGAVWRRGSFGERALLLGAAATVAALMPRGEWYGGGSPPARYLAPLLPLAVLALAEVARTRRGRSLIALAIPWAAVAGWVAATRPLWLFNPVDGGWWLADGLARTLSVAARAVFPTLLRPGPAALTVPVVVGGLAWMWHRRAQRGGAAATLALLALVMAWGTSAGEGRVDIEDPQVRHLGGRAEPPPGSFNRAARAISWRVPPGAEVHVPWRPRMGRPLWAVVRIDGPPASSGRLSARWENGEEHGRQVSGERWQRLALPPPAGLGRSTLRLRWEGTTDGRDTDLLIDRVEATP